MTAAEHALRMLDPLGRAKPVATTEPPNASPYCHSCKTFHHRDERLPGFKVYRRVNGVELKIFEGVQHDATLVFYAERERMRVGEIRMALPPCIGNPRFLYNVANCEPQKSESYPQLIPTGRLGVLFDKIARDERRQRFVDAGFGSHVGAV